MKDGTIKYKFSWVDLTSDSEEPIVEWATEEEFWSMMDTASFQEYAWIKFWPVCTKCRK
jgi:hypothetical protein